MNITEKVVDEALDKLLEADSKADLKYYYVKTQEQDGTEWGYKIFGDGGIYRLLTDSLASSRFKQNLNAPHIVRLIKGIDEFEARMKRQTAYNRLLTAAKKLQDEGDNVGSKIKIVEAFIAAATSKEYLKQKAKDRLKKLVEIYESDKDPKNNKKIEKLVEKYNETYRSLN